VTEVGGGRGELPHGHLSIVGPTASGKTALACAVARLGHGVELVSVDSMSVYRGMDIGTAKPTARERAAAPWHMLDLVEPSEEFSVAAFQSLARRALGDIASRGARAVLVGGTGLYHRAVVDHFEIPGRWPSVLAELEATAALPGGLAHLYDRLSTLDPPAAAKIEPNNLRRVLRALEVTLGSGRPFSSFGPGLTEYPPGGAVVVGLRIERGVLAERLRRRLDEQMEAGFLEEVRRLAAAPGGLSRTARQALGYRELLAHVVDGVPLDRALEEALVRMRRFAKRQESWFGRDPRVVWLDAEREDLAVAVREAWLAGQGMVASNGARRWR
jgi:tRNA dimethylallyltransferase